MRQESWASTKGEVKTHPKGSQPLAFSKGRCEGNSELFCRGLEDADVHRLSRAWSSTELPVAGIVEVGMWTKSFLESLDSKNDFVYLIIYWLWMKNNACNLLKSYLSTVHFTMAPVSTALRWVLSVPAPDLRFIQIYVSYRYISVSGRNT